jgi:hypothetical protein
VVRRERRGKMASTVCKSSSYLRRCVVRWERRGEMASSVGRVSGDQARWNTCLFNPDSN